MLLIHIPYLHHLMNEDFSCYHKIKGHLTNLIKLHSNVGDFLIFLKIFILMIRENDYSKFE